MNQKFIVEDSSFLVALMNSNDPLHSKTLPISKQILTNSDVIKVIIPTPVIFETLFALIRNGISQKIVEEKLWNLLMIDDVLNYPVIETSALRLAKKTAPLIRKLPQDSILPANDLMILTVALEFKNCCVITFDKGMKKFSRLCPNLFYLLEENGENGLLDFLNAD